jgi:hypothetical protein
MDCFDGEEERAGDGMIFGRDMADGSGYMVTKSYEVLMVCSKVVAELQIEEKASLSIASGDLSRHEIDVAP